MSGIEIIIGAVVYVTTNAIWAGVLMLLKKFDTKKFLGLMNEFKSMGEKVQSMGDKSNTLINTWNGIYYLIKLGF